MRSQSAHRRVAGLGWVFVFVAALLSAPAAAPGEFERGKVIEKVVCGDFADQSYALYLPSGFMPAVRRPVLYLFDPGTRGPVAVERFLQAAEKYGWILVASNNSRNGPWEPNLKAARAMFEGSRAACIFSRIIMRRVTGIIGVGAGISNTGTRPEDIGASSYFGIIGLADFNYPEMIRLDADLDRAKVPHRVLFYEAPHQWPDPGTCIRAVGWMEITAMKQGKRSRNEALIDEMLGKELENASALEDQKDLERIRRTAKFRELVERVKKIQ